MPLLIATKKTKKNASIKQESQDVLSQILSAGGNTLCLKFQVFYTQTDLTVLGLFFGIFVAFSKKLKAKREKGRS